MDASTQRALSGEPDSSATSSGPPPEVREPSLWSTLGPRRFPILALIVAAALALSIGWALPVVTLRRGLSRDTYSVLAGILDLARGGNVFLALILFVFSIIFPAAKLGLLGGVLFLRVGAERSSRVLRWLSLLGRWSMLDVFVVVILVGSVHLGLLSAGEPRAGILVFALAILLSMIASLVLELCVRRDEPEPRLAEPRSRLRRALSLLTCVLFVVGLSLPLMRVEKWVFWDQDYSVLEATWRLFDEGHLALAGAVLVFVVLVPLVRFAGLAWMRWGAPPPRARRAVRIVDQWAMLDVFALALMIVIVKIGELGTVVPRPAFWVLLAAVLLSLSDSRALQAERRA